MEDNYEPIIGISACRPREICTLLFKIETSEYIKLNEFIDLLGFEMIFQRWQMHSINHNGPIIVNKRSTWFVYSSDIIDRIERRLNQLQIANRLIYNNYVVS
jgi:hypothetical protein